MKYKYWLIILIVIIAVLVGYFIFQTKPAEYAEMTDDPHVKGNPEASLVLIEFSDFQCPACGYAFATLTSQLDQYFDKLKFEYRHFPLESIHPYAFRAAEASECAADQGKFWEYHDLLFQNQKSLTKKDLALYAARIDGLDVELWQDCLDSGLKASRVRADLSEASGMGLNSTPTFILGGQIVKDWTQLPQMIESLVNPLVPLQNNSTSTQLNLINDSLFAS